MPARPGNPGPLIDYKQLRRINAEAARRAVLEYLHGNGGNVAGSARAFGITRRVVYDILKKQRQGDLQDRSKAPRHQPGKTPDEVEAKVLQAKNKTRLGPKRLSIHLSKYEGLCVPAGTIRHILRRNRDKIRYRPDTSGRKEKREFVDWYSAKPFEIVQMDVKFIRDQDALSKDQIIHLDSHGIPNYQSPTLHSYGDGAWSALDVNSRFKLIGYSRERSWTNGLCWYLWVISRLRPDQSGLRRAK
jgi:transposase